MSERTHCPKTGTLADLHEFLKKRGFTYFYDGLTADEMKRQQENGILLYSRKTKPDLVGSEFVELRRISKGQPRISTGANTGFTSIAGTPDIYALLHSPHLYSLLGTKHGKIEDC